MRAYIVGGGMDGTEEVQGVYHLVTADGVTWATQWCESFEDAMKELYVEREGLKEDWAEKYDHVEVVRLGCDAMTLERLAMKQDHAVYAKQSGLADGVYFSIIKVKNGVWEKTDPKPIDALAGLVANTIAEKFKK